MTGIRPVDAALAAGLGTSTYGPAAAAGRSSTGGRNGGRPTVDWSQVLAELEGEVVAAEQTLADGRAEEIAA